MAYLGVPSGRVSTVRWPICMSDGASEVQGECRAELARAMLSRSLHSPSQLLVCDGKGTTSALRFTNTSKEIYHFPASFLRQAAVAVLISSTTAGARHSSSKLGSALAVAVVAVLQFSEKYSHAQNMFYIYIYIYIYINIELFFYTVVGFILNCNTATTATATLFFWYLPDRFY